MERDRVAEVMADAVRRQAREVFADDTEGNDVVLAALDHSRVWSGIPSYRSLRDLSLSLRSTAGAFVKCGVAQGTSLVIMAALAGPDRLVWGSTVSRGSRNSLRQMAVRALSSSACRVPVRRARRGL